MTNQAQVLEIYKKVIEKTIESARTELVDKAVSESALDTLNLLKARWLARLTQTHDFTDDPALIDKPTSSAARGGKKAGAKGGKKKNMVPVQVNPSTTSPTTNVNSTNPNTPSNSTSTPAASSDALARNGVLPVTALTNASDDISPENLPSVPRVPSHLRKAEDDEVQEVGVEQPPTKRARVTRPEDDDDGQIENVGEDLDSDDSDVEGEDSDEEAENLVLAQHDKVRKGQKWKVMLREGIVCIRGREYLFNKATCDLDF